MPDIGIIALNLDLSAAGDVHVCDSSYIVGQWPVIFAGAAHMGFLHLLVLCLCLVPVKIPARNQAHCTWQTKQTAVNSVHSFSIDFVLPATPEKEPETPITYCL